MFTSVALILRHIYELWDTFISSQVCLVKSDRTWGPVSIRTLKLCIEGDWSLKRVPIRRRGLPGFPNFEKCSIYEWQCCTCSCIYAAVYSLWLHYHMITLQYEYDVLWASILCGCLCHLPTRSTSGGIVFSLYHPWIQTGYSCILPRLMGRL